MPFSEVMDKKVAAMRSLIGPVRVTIADDETAWGGKSLFFLHFHITVHY